MGPIVVAGALANKAGSSGEAWVRMTWVRGFAALGFDVWFVEQLDTEGEADPRAVEWFRSVIGSFGLEDRATLLCKGRALTGPDLSQLVDVAAEASLVNISGHLTRLDLKDAFRRRVMVDIDPGFTQFWHENGLAASNTEGHDAYFTIGELIGTPGCPVPTGGMNWQPVRQPVLLDDWPVAPSPAPDRFTTVGSWRGPFGPIERGGHTYGLKVHEFRRFMPLPKRSAHSFELALDIHPDDSADLERLRGQGWRVVDPRRVAGDPAAFRSYIQDSGSEFSVAQGVYVDTACGWFSDRTTRYLASGRPALVQDTGFSRILPVGRGLIPFTTIEEAAAGADSLVANFEEHSAAARKIAEEHFSAPVVLASFCDRAQIGQPGR